MIDRDAFMARLFTGDAPAGQMELTDQPAPAFQTMDDLAFELYGDDGAYTDAGAPPPLALVGGVWKADLTGVTLLPSRYYRWRIKIPFVQPLQLTPQGYLSPDGLESALDRQCMMLQQVRGEWG